MSKKVSRSRMMACGTSCGLSVLHAALRLMAVPMASTSTKLLPISLMNSLTPITPSAFDVLGLAADVVQGVLARLVHQPRHGVHLAARERRKNVLRPPAKPSA